MKNKINVGIIGYGNVGGSICKYFKRYKRKIFVLTRKNIENEKYIEFYNYEKIEEFLKKVNLILICIRDDKIFEIIETLKNFDLSGKIIYHTSGSLTSDILKSLKNVYVGSLHPIQTFPKPNYKLLENIYFSFEGEKFRIAQKLVKFFKSKIIKIDKEKKMLYHIACIFASNFSDLMWIISDKLIKSSIRNKNFKILVPLIKTTLNNAIKYGPKEALTGPAKRKDYELIKKHLKALENNKEIFEIYKLLSEIILKGFSSF
ncbi:MAG: DUF2520 domain-containing protein [candidate division WOR-3 bacterium]